MAVRTMRIEGDPILRKVAKEVDVVDDRIRKHLDDMLETMYDSGNGVGLAGPQVGILRRIFVMDVGDGAYKLVNPVIVDAEEEVLGIEGCLSVPEFNGTVMRPRKLTVEYLDENGEKQRLEAEGLKARCICHEIDHLDGILFRDKVVEEVDWDNLTPAQAALLSKEEAEEAAEKEASEEDNDQSASGEA